MAKEIPGFYFDEEKGKYFRIQQNHRVVPGTGYTKQSVEEAKQVQKEKQHAQQQVKRQRLGKIVRSRLSLHTASPLSARLGASVIQNKDEVQKRYATGLSRCLLNGPNLSHELQAHGSVEGSSFSITRSGSLVMNVNETFAVSNLSTRPNPRHSEGESVDLPPLRIVDHYSVINNYNDLITTLHNEDGTENLIVCCNSSVSCVVTTFGSARSPNDMVWMDFNLARMKAEIIWDIAAAPTSPVMAIATDAGLVIGDCHDVHAMSLSLPQHSTRREQMNVCFKDSNIIMSGERSGRINLTDARVGQSVARLLHSSAVVGTLSLHGSNHVLAHGYSTTSVYDLRWVQQVPIHRKARSTDRGQCSETYLNFAVPKNRWSDRYTRGRKVAYSADLDLVAAASSNQRHNKTHGYVTLYSARTGRVVDSPLTRHVYEDVVSCIDIKRVRDGPESIFCLSECRINEWTCGRMSRDDLDHYDFSSQQHNVHKTTLEERGLSFQQEWDRENIYH